MSLIYIIEVALGIGLLVFIHELGHFVLAKLSGVTVERFSIGFGPELLGFTRGETRYSFRLLPFISYVKMLGEEPGSESAADARSFTAQPYHRKVAIIAAGTTANILLALVLFVAVFQVGMPFPAAHIGYVEYGAPAFYAGIRPGDRVISIDGRTDVDFTDLAVKAALADPGEILNLVIERDGRTFPLAVPSEYVPAEGTGHIGVERYPTLRIEAFLQVDKTEDPVQAAGVETGSTIISANGVAMESWTQFRRFVAANGLEPYSLTVKRAGAERTYEIRPVRNTAPFLNVFATQTTEVVSIAPGSVADLVGLKAGDVILAVGGKPVSDLHEVRNAINTEPATLGPLKVKRGDSTLEIAWTVRPRSGLEFAEALETATLPRIAWVEPGSAGEFLGLHPGDYLLSVDGKPVADFEAFKENLKASTGDTVTLTWRRGDVEMRGAFQPVFLGISPAVETIERKLGFVASCSMGVRKAWDFASQIYILLRKAFSGQAAIAKSLRGPVAIAQTSYRIAQQGVIQLVFFLAVIGVNLAVMNLLPLPLLDGGLLVLFTVEKVRGKPLSLAAQAAFQYAGIAIIGALILFITWQDIYRIVTGG